jgi:hypothetical protein
MQDVQPVFHHAQTLAHVLTTCRRAAF